MVPLIVMIISQFVVQMASEVSQQLRFSAQIKIPPATTRVLVLLVELLMLLWLKQRLKYKRFLVVVVEAAVVAASPLMMPSNSPIPTLMSSF